MTDTTTPETPSKTDCPESWHGPHHPEAAFHADQCPGCGETCTHEGQLRVDEDLNATLDGVPFENPPTLLHGGIIGILPKKPKPSRCGLPDVPVAELTNSLRRITCIPCLKAMHIDSAEKAAIAGRIRFLEDAAKPKRDPNRIRIGAHGGIHG